MPRTKLQDRVDEIKRLQKEKETLTKLDSDLTDAIMGTILGAMQMRNMSQYHLARACSVSPSTIVNRRKNSLNLTVLEVLRMGKLLGIPIALEVGQMKIKIGGESK